ncbi:MAG: protoporphyrinogen oxidase, partial [Acidimicrobiales bacterium]
AFDVVLLEASTATGGLIRTTEFRGEPLDAAADVFITRTPDAEKLALALGLGGELVAPSTTAASVFARGAVRSLPSGLVLGVPTDLRALWGSGVVSPFSVLRATGDLLRVGAMQPNVGADPTIADVIEPRLGREILANLIDPLLGGINAGDARRLSFAAAAPMLAEATTGKASLIRALRPLARREPSSSESSIFLGFAEGMATLTERLAGDCQRRGVTIRLSTSARSVNVIEDGSVRVETPSGAVKADGAVVALPAWAAAPLVRQMSPSLAREFESIPYASVATISIAYPLADAAVSPRMTGSGVLIPRGEALCTALTFVSRKWPQRTNATEFVIRASVGRFGDDRALELDDAELARRAHSEIAAMFGLTSLPIATHVERFADAFPQYVSGHLARRERIAQLSGGLGPVTIAGSWSGGIGIPSCVATAHIAARELSDRLQ